ncbi:DUF2628 domain-containing protein [Chryseobacterium sp. 2TAF14]|uniref:DUF2628 domain-containing protein n=1 Tax=Chryseobacterium sp. 2TAF14 TaxID=3233007 RepID=UPI003F926458
MEKNIELYESFFQERKDYYLEKLRLLESNKKFTINYAALIFGILWFFYRKMYLEILIIYSFIALETLFEKYFLSMIIGEESMIIFSIAFSISLLIFVGFTGNYLYLKKAKRTITKAEKKYINLEMQKQYVTKKGGTSFIFIWIIIVLGALYAALK